MLEGAEQKRARFLPVERVKLDARRAKQSLRLGRAALQFRAGGSALAGTRAQHKHELAAAQALALLGEVAEKLRVGVRRALKRRVGKSGGRAPDRGRAL